MFDAPRKATDPTPDNDSTVDGYVDSSYKEIDNSNYNVNSRSFSSWQSHQNETSTSLLIKEGILPSVTIDGTDSSSKSPQTRTRASENNESKVRTGSGGSSASQAASVTLPAGEPSGGKTSSSPAPSASAGQEPAETTSPVDGLLSNKSAVAAFLTNARLSLYDQSAAVSSTTGGA